MTHTLDQRARELLAKHCDERTAAAIVLGATVIIETTEALAALTEALARIEGLESERNAGGFAGINSVMNERLRDANETICEQRSRIEELEGALKHIQSGITRKVATPFISHSQPSKQDRCQHGQYMYEDCEACIDVFIDEVLAKEIKE